MEKLFWYRVALTAVTVYAYLYALFTYRDEKGEGGQTLRTWRGERRRGGRRKPFWRLPDTIRFMFTCTLSSIIYIAISMTGKNNILVSNTLHRRDTNFCIVVSASLLLATTFFRFSVVIDNYILAMQKTGGMRLGQFMTNPGNSVDVSLWGGWGKRGCGAGAKINAEEG